MKKKVNPIRTIFPFIWTQCDRCGSEYRFERMYTNGRVVICRECEPDKFTAVKVIADLEKKLKEYEYPEMAGNGYRGGDSGGKKGTPPREP